jgi:hypothetical protein
VTIAVGFASKLPLNSVHIGSIRGKLVAPIETTCELSWDLNRVLVHWGEDEGLLKVLVPFEISIASAPKGGTPKKVVEIGVIFRLDYGRPAEVRASDDELSHFAGVHGVMHSWPYLRAEVQAMTSKLEVPPLTLPSLLAGKIADFVSVAKMPSSNETNAASDIPRRPNRKHKRAKKAGARGET